MNQQPLIPTCVQLRQGHMTTTCTCMYDHRAHSIHLAPRGLHSSVQVPQSQSKVRQTHKDNEDMKSLSFQTCSYSNRQVVRNERQNEQFLRRWCGLASIQQVRVTKLLGRQHYVSLPLINAYMQYIKTPHASATTYSTCTCMTSSLCSWASSIVSAWLCVN